LEDTKIIQMYWDRDEAAIVATAEKYGNYCRSIANNILGNNEDAEECVNDTYLRVWNSIPPHSPNVLSAYLGRVTRNLALNKYSQKFAGKRGGGEIPIVLDELTEIVSCTENVEQEIDNKELVDAINMFLDTLTPKQRIIFVSRYWYTDSITEIAACQGMKKGTVSMTLNRIRNKLQNYLSERGFEL